MIDLHPQASHHEILAVLARSIPVRDYLEVGVREGVSLCVVYEGAIDTLRHCALADDWGTAHGGTGRGSHDHIEQFLRVANYYAPGRGVTWLDGRSQETVPRMLDGLRFDLAHVDGDHDEQPAYEDMVNCHRALRPGGAMVVHDTNYPPVARALERFCEDARADAVLYRRGLGTAVVWKGDA